MSNNSAKILPNDIPKMSAQAGQLAQAVVREQMKTAPGERKMGRDLNYIVFGIVTALAALIMAASIKPDSRPDFSFNPEFKQLSSRPAATKHFFRPGSGIGVSANLPDGSK